MIVLKKENNNYNFVKWFNSENEAPVLKSGEIIEKDEAMAFIFCENEKVITNKRHCNEKEIQEYINEGYQMYDFMSFDWIDDKTKHEVYNDNGKCALKTKKQVLLEEKEKKKKEIAMELLKKYPEKQIDGTLNDIYQIKLTEINNTTKLEDLKIIRV
jgi:hypothetical protein